MSGHRPITRSRSRKFAEDYFDHDGPQSEYIPLNIPKLGAQATSGRQRIDMTAIGLALGSPQENSLPPLPSDDPNYFNTFTFPNPTNSRPRADTDVSMGGIRDNKTKISRWKSFGGLFSKKEAMARTGGDSIYSLDQSAQHAWRTVPNRTSPGTRKRAGSDKEKGMDLHNAMVGKQIARGPSILRRASTKRKGMRRRKPSEVKAEVPKPPSVLLPNALTGNPPDVIRGRRRRDNTAQTQGGFSLLQVEIPNVELERYSVMFGNVLKPGLQAPSLSPSVRSRQPSTEGANLSVTSLEAPPRLNDLPSPHRRDASASSARSKSPSFSLFPLSQPPPSRGVVNKPLPKPSPLSRSVTAPDIKTTTPPRPSIKPNKSQDVSQLLTAAPGKENIPVSKFTTHSRQSSLQISHNRKSSLDRSIRSQSHGHIAQLSFDSSHRTAASHSRKPSFDPSIRSTSDSQSSFFEAPEFSTSPQPTSIAPSTRPVTASNNNNNTKQDFLNRAFPTRKSSLKHPANTKMPIHATENLPPPSPNPSDLNLEPPNPPYYFTGNATSHSSTDSVGSAAEVSIARQISFSRRQRQLLVPVVSKTARQPLTPHVENVCGVNGGGRKSEFGLLEQAE